MEIDVLIPFHRVDDYLHKSIKSVVNNIEIKPRIILIDDRPKGNRPLSGYLSDFEVVISGGVGYAKALKEGLSIVTSDFVGFQDSDDLSNLNRLSLQIKSLESTDSQISICQLKRVDERGSRMIFQPPRFHNTKNLKLSNLLGSINSNSSWVCRREITQKDWFMPRGYESIDWATTLLMPNNIKIQILSQRLYQYRQHKLQMTRSADYKSTSFTQIYPLWLAVNDFYGLPNLTENQAASICSPWSRISHVDYESTEWLIEFLKCVDRTDRSEVFNFINIFVNRLRQNEAMNNRQRLFVLRRILKGV